MSNLKRLLTKDAVLVVLLWLGTVATFFTYSLREGLVLILSLLLAGGFYIIFRSRAALSSNLTNTLKLAGCFYLLISFFHFRYMSWDGLIAYTRNTYLLSTKWSLTGIGAYYYPYLMELVLGKVLKLTSLNIVNLLLGVASLAALYTSYLLLKEVIQDSKVIKFSLLLLTFSPTFLAFAFYEFKVENVLLTLSNLCLLFLFRHTKKPTTKYALLGGLFGAFAVLVKISYLPIFALFFGVFVLFGKVLRLRYFPHVLVSLVAFVTPLAVWALFYGLNIPYVGVTNTGLLTASSKPNFASAFDLNTTVQNQCRRESTTHSFGHYYYGNLLTQPFYYFFRPNIPRNEVDLSPCNKADPGIFLYIGFFLLPYLLINKKSVCILPKKVWLLPAVLIALVFYVTVKGVYWYIYPIYPFMALASALCFKRLLHSRLFLLLFMSVSVYDLLCATVPYIAFLDPAPTLDQTRIKTALDSKTQAFNAIAPGEYALNAFTREDILIVPTTFIKDSDEKLAEIPYFFASSNKTSYDAMATELTANGVHYIVAAFDYLLYERTFGACLKTDRDKLYEFLVHKTVKTSSPMLYKIVD